MGTIAQVIHECETCTAIKQAKWLKPLWYGGRWLKYKYGEAWQTDYITVPQTLQGKCYVLPMVEATTGWLETYPVPHATTWNTILGLEENIELVLVFLLYLKPGCYWTAQYTMEMLTGCHRNTEAKLHGRKLCDPKLILDLQPRHLGVSRMALWEVPSPGRLSCQGSCCQLPYPDLLGRPQGLLLNEPQVEGSREDENQHRSRRGTWKRKQS
ncbi:hypothetical protein QYF61_001452 [Mycteria americana]|uniref:Integrase catalytic domain-containing protein n=1 Tax=Mycteria americana TaxID=33587 RepID=A0AAN7NQY4_MYCAM|nr:hypothetical protein QYF61_001452 [Mycteria americana]